MFHEFWNFESTIFWLESVSFYIGIFILIEIVRITSTVLNKNWPLAEMQ